MNIVVSPLSIKAVFGKKDMVLSMAALGCDLNRSMQHLDSHYREEDVENEVSDEDLLH